MLIQYLKSVLLLSRWSYEAPGPTSSAFSPGGDYLLSTFSSMLKFGGEETFRTRSTRTPWPVNHVLQRRSPCIGWRQNFCSDFLSVDFISLMGRGEDASINFVYFVSNLPVPDVDSLHDKKSRCWLSTFTHRSR